ncbi:alkylhydroperoxidase [Polaribacter sp. SA4-10]|uniref:carboxymuconolactone decarboxylase family protein n=1 Tax=Polaribacter sp. SA4-10 TaxID=754397 RepID=UPI000B55771A|nr:carboxymuconolactone decarboxylase family protein [Polaribacter sp. SA4-10]ARV05790.1 alkylhydroperoxidase [Polaribacter sp. SA4-10]
MKDFMKHYEEISLGMEAMGLKIPATMTAFGKLHETAVTEGVLTTKTKELIALGIAITVRCDGCVAFHVHDALRAGATDDEIMETIGVAILMGGGPAVVYGCEAMEALKQFKVLA